VPIERCVAISREVETLLDAADAVAGAYRLEVSSPGLDRLLGREKDFVAAIDQEVKLRTRRPIEGRRRYRGRLRGVEAGVLKMEVDGVEALVPIDEVEKANTIYAFSSADFAKQSAPRSEKNGRRRGRSRGKRPSSP
jgi:ribosome maturation factor RimP